MQHYVSSTAESKVLESCFVTAHSQTGSSCHFLLCFMLCSTTLRHAALGEQSCWGWETWTYICLIRGFALCRSQDCKVWSGVAQSELLQALQRLRAAAPQLGFPMKSFHQIETWSFVCLDFFLRSRAKLSPKDTYIVRWVLSVQLPVCYKGKGLYVQSPVTLRVSPRDLL